MRHAETIVVGGGPGGSSCAGELAGNGRECLVLEHKRMPRVKLCAGWITPRVLADLNIQPSDYPHGLIPLDTITVVAGRSRRFARSTPSHQYSIRRVEFDAWLLARSGVEVVHHTVRRIEADAGAGGFTIDGRFRCRYLVGAGGTNCPVRRALFGDDGGELVLTQEIEYATTVAHAHCTLWFPYAGRQGYGWYVPKAGAVNVGFGGLRSELMHWDRRALWREFTRLLRDRGCICDDPPEPAGYSYYFGRRRKRVKAGHAYIVGDAAGLATFDMAEGIGPAVESGLLAARDILGQGCYTIDRVTKYSLPPVARALRHLVPRMF